MRELSIISATRLKNQTDGYITGVRCYFKLMRLLPGQRWSTLDYMSWVSIQQNAFSEELRKHNQKPADFWEAFDRWLTRRVSGDSYIIYKPLSSQYQAPMSAIKKWGLSINDKEYKPVWSAPLENDMDVLSASKNAQVNIAVALGDVVVLTRGDKRAAWFLDQGGFVKIKGFELMRWNKE